MPRNKAVLIAAAASILLVFASAVLALNAGLFNAGADNVGKLTPAAATAPAAPTTITVYLDPAATAPAVPPLDASADTAPTTNESRQSEPAEKRDHDEQEGHDD
jgi:hypothetical protein